MPYMLNGQSVSLSREPMERDGTVYVPLSDLAVALGGQATWDNKTKMVAVTIGQWTANVQMMNTAVDVNGKGVNISAPPLVEDGKMYVPWDFFRDCYGYKASMDADTLTISR